MPLIADRIAEAFASAGTSGLLHARDLDTGESVDYQAEAPVVLASVFKIPVLLAYARDVTAGRMDPRQRVRIRERDRVGGIGTAGCADDVEMSWRDLALFMMSMSDNAATDTILDAVGLDAVRQVTHDAGLTRTVIDGSCRDLFALMRTGFGLDEAGDLNAAVAAASLAQLQANPAMDPTRSLHRSTPREVTSLLARMWNDWGDDPATTLARAVMSRQIWEHRLAAGFEADVSIASKTGTLPMIRNEAGVLTYPDGGRYAVAVFTRTATTSHRLPAVDAAIGRTARLAVDELRRRAGVAR